MVMVMNLYSDFSIDIFKCALQVTDLWVRSDISIYTFDNSISVMNNHAWSTLTLPQRKRFHI